MLTNRRGTLFWITSMCTVGVLLIAWRFLKRRTRLSSISNHLSFLQPSVTQPIVPPTTHEPSIEPPRPISELPPEPQKVSHNFTSYSTVSPQTTSTHVIKKPTSNLASLLSLYHVTVVETTVECEERLSSLLSKQPMIVGLDCEWTNLQNLNEVTSSNRGENIDSISSSVCGDENMNCDTGDGGDISEGGYAVDICDGGDDGDNSEGGDGGDNSEGGDARTTRSHHTFPVALLQLAFTSGECLLIRLSKMKEISPQLEDILTNKSVLKFGVGIGMDVKRLAAGFGVQALGCVDLQHIAVRSGVSGNTGLQSLTLQLLGLKMDKTFHVRCSDWEVPTLSQRQVDYAAADAIVALHILKALVQRKTFKQDRRESAACLTTSNNVTNSISLPTKSFSTLELSSRDNPEGPDMITDCGEEVLEKWISESDVQVCVMSLCQGVVDLTYKQPRRNSSRQNLELSQNGHAPSKRNSAYSARRTRLYHNCKLLAPDGQLLSTIDKRKVEWYLQRELATVVCESPLTVRLHFEPAGRPGEDRRYYLKQKENICVVCGTEQNCIRKNVVPHEYRKYFPPTMKEHISHDIVLMCVSCHQLASQHDAILKAQIAMEHGALVNISTQKFNEDPKLLHIRNHARALLKNGSSIPAERKKELLETVQHHYGCEEVNEELLKEAAQISTKSLNTDYVSHAELVVARLKREEKVFEFQRRWREHFLRTMKPRYLPELWSVDHNPR